MKVLIDGFEEYYGESIKIVKTLMKRESEQEYPEQFKWKLQMVYLHGSEWIEICRIDNYPHEGQCGAHIHEYGQDRIKRVEATFVEACEIMIKRGESIMRNKFNRYADFSKAKEVQNDH